MKFRPRPWTVGASRKERAISCQPVGYRTDLNPNADWQKRGLTCEWEHCIELFPLPESKSVLGCPVFGHCCPGGPEQAEVCRVIVTELPTPK